MPFPMHSIATEYVYRRYPRASILEKEKYVRDWVNKIEASRALVADFKARVGDPAHAKILDAGCGNGGISIAFAEADAIVSGIEVEKELYEISTRHGQALSSPASFFLYDGRRLPFDDNFFDYAVSASVLEHTDDPVLYLSEILRVVKPGGSLYLGFPNKVAPRETHTQLLFLTYLPARLRPLYIKLLRRNPLEDNNLHFYGYGDFRRVLAQIRGQSGTAYAWEIVEEKGSSPSLMKKFLKRVLAAFGISYKAILPHVLVILRKTEKK